MFDPRKQRRKKIAIWALVLFLLPALYLLSAGPWSYADSHDILPRPVFEAVKLFYTPLSLIHDNTRFFQENPFGQAYMAYVDWWRDL